MIKKTLEDHILNFDNNYPFTSKGELELSVSVVIPYFESKNTINECLKHAVSSTKKYRGGSEIIVIDDGSIKFPAQKHISDDNLQGEIKIVTLHKNRGRYHSRNIGLRLAKNDLVFFIDSDVLIYPMLISSHANIHASLLGQEKSSVTFCLFNFVEGLDKKNLDFDSTNDFRDFCVYQKSWKGSDEDEKFAGIEYKIIKQTDNLKRWPKDGKLGPWMLPNMVLGGCFALLKKHAMSVNGCSGIFGKYGFEETSLVTKLMAKYHSYLIPVIDRYAVHMFDDESAIKKKKRDALFQKTHAIYFNQFIKQTLNEAIENDKKYFKKE